MPTIDAKESKHEKLAGDLRRLIESRTLKPGDPMPTFRSLRRDFGVSQATYERAQSLLEREGVVARNPGRGTLVVEPRKIHRPGCIAVTDVGPLAKQSTGYWGGLFDGIRDAAKADKKSVLVLDHIDEDTDWTGISGLIAGHPRNISPSVPCVTLLCQLPGCTSVGADEHAGVWAAMNHLTTLGHRKIGYLYWPSLTQEERVSAYLGGLMSAGIAPDPRWIREIAFWPPGPDFFYNAALESMKYWIETDWSALGCTALLAHNDDTAVGAIEALRQAGYSVPGNISVVGFDGIFDEVRSQIDLTTVVLPLFELGRIAVRQLRLASDANAGAVSVKLDAPLHLGATTAVASVT